MINVLQDFLSNINLFDIFVFIIVIYNVTQCFYKGFSLSLISFSKWILSTIVTIILVPKLQPVVSEYIQSEFINNLGLGIRNRPDDVSMVGGNVFLDYRMTDYSDAHSRLGLGGEYLWKDFEFRNNFYMAKPTIIDRDSVKKL